MEVRWRGTGDEITSSWKQVVSMLLESPKSTTCTESFQLVNPWTVSKEGFIDEKETSFKQKRQGQCTFERNSFPFFFSQSLSLQCSTQSWKQTLSTSSDKYYWALMDFIFTTNETEFWSKGIHHMLLKAMQQMQCHSKINILPRRDL